MAADLSMANRPTGVPDRCRTLRKTTLLTYVDSYVALVYTKRDWGKQVVWMGMRVIFFFLAQLNFIQIGSPTCFSFFFASTSLVLAAINSQNELAVYACFHFIYLPQTPLSLPLPSEAILAT